jgi:hypothetical protein
VAPPVASAAPARTIYVAKPAADMRPAYLRLVDELTNRQFAVTPPLEADIPHESEAEATAFIAKAMSQAELSIHLVGEKLGYVPDEGDPIVKLQLRMADEHAADPAALPGFRRYIWAPAFLFDRDGEPLGTTERDPFEVLARFDRLSPNDTIVGSEPTVFINDVVRYLEQSAKPLAPEPLQAGGEVYICHREDDTEWALEVAGALKEQHLGARFPAFDSDVGEVTNVHRRALETCDAVVLCWANAGEAWIKAQSAELKRWEDLGRERRFACRTVVAGPPPGMRKNVFRDFPPPNEIDLVIDLSANQTPTAQALDPLVRATRDLGPAEGPKPHAT